MPRASRSRERLTVASSDGLCNKSLRGERALWDAHCAGWLCLQKGLQCGSDAGCEVLGRRGTHLLSEHTPGGHNTLSAHSRTPPYTLGSTAPATQPQAAGGGVPGKKLGSPPHHFTLLYRTIMDFLGLSSPCCPHPCSEDGRGEKEAGKGYQMLTHLLSLPEDPLKLCQP